MIATLVVQATEPINDMLDLENTLWLNTTDGFIYYWNGSSYVKAAHLHATLGDINFTGTISVGGTEGIDLDFTGEMDKITRLVIKKGVITQLEYEE